jgi:excisionase family DNA binding protein
MNDTTTTMLFPYEPHEFWEHMRFIISEEIAKTAKEKLPVNPFETMGLNYKPLLKITEVCSFFQVTRPTIYDWIKHGKLKPRKVRRSVYFLWNDIQQLLTE